MKKPLEDVQATVFKALGHPTRVRIVSILAGGGRKCVCELVDQLGCDQSTISRHLTVLKTAGILKSTKQGLNVLYEIGMPCVTRFLKCVECVATSDAEEPECDSCKMCETDESSQSGGH